MPDPTSPLEDVTKIEFKQDGKLSFNYDGSKNHSFSTENGFRFKVKRVNGVWNAEFTQNSEVDGDHTAILTRLNGTKLDFEKFNDDDTTAMEFIGITDIRDGVAGSPEFLIYFGATDVSIKAKDGRLDIRKAHKSSTV